jgi:hypothetical protein
MTATDAAWLVLGLYGADNPVNAAEAADAFGNLTQGTSLGEIDPLLAPLRQAKTLVEAVAAAIELAPTYTEGRSAIQGGRRALLSLERPRLSALLTIDSVGAATTFSFGRNRYRRRLDAPPVAIEARITEVVFVSLHRTLFPDGPS